MICFEFPVSERTRSLLRLEHLYERLSFFVHQDSLFEHHAALQTIFELLETASRADLKTDLIQELERQKQVLDGWRASPVINESLLDETLESIESTTDALLNITGKFGAHIRENEWLMSIRQRSNIPGGTCQFDLPSYYLWLQKSVELRRKDLEHWIEPLLPTSMATSLLLRLLREGGKSQRNVAHGGKFQQMSGGKVVQLFRLKYKQCSLDIFPELAANKYMLNIRFIQAVMNGERAQQVERDVEFELISCKF